MVIGNDSGKMDEQDIEGFRFLLKHNSKCYNHLDMGKCWNWQTGVT